MRKRRPAELVAWDAASERTATVVRAVIGLSGTSLVAALGLTVIGLAQTQLGWFLFGVAAAVGMVPAAVVHLHQSRRQERLPVTDLSPASIALVAQAVTYVERLRALAAASPEGPVADHFAHLATTADRYVGALHTALRQNQVVDDIDVRHDVERIVAQLAELTEAAAELRRAQRQHLEASPLETLTDQTRHLTRAIETEAIEVDAGADTIGAAAPTLPAGNPSSGLPRQSR